MTNLLFTGILWMCIYSCTVDLNSLYLAANSGLLSESLYLKLNNEFEKLLCYPRLFINTHLYLIETEKNTSALLN